MDEGKSFSHVLLIETASNQKTIFHTNRERENAGASQLVHLVGTEFVTYALNVLDFKENIDVKIAVSVSGKAIILTKDFETAKKIAERVTARAALECPGVIARGAIARIGAWTAEGLEKAIETAHRRHADLAARLPSPAARFPALPFVETCLSSGYPAAARHPDPNIQGAVSSPSLAKWTAGRKGLKRISEALPELNLYGKLQHFDRDSDYQIKSRWLGIVHADGNGLGEVFRSFRSYLPPGASAGDYAAALRKFSNAIDSWAKKAAAEAIRETWKEVELSLREREGRGGKKGAKAVAFPVIPVVLGGDDLTVICEGERAVQFAAAYALQFEKQSAAWMESEGAKLLPKLADRKRVAVGVGVAIVKRNFPFFRAYELAGDLIKSAKTAKQHVRDVPCSALDYHVLFDTSGADLDRIRERLTAPGGGRLTMRPYVVTPLAALNNNAWAERRHYRDGCPSLHCAIEALLKKAADGERDGTAHLPRSQAHALLDALYQGPDIANGRMAQIQHRYSKFAWDAIAKDNSLFVEDGDAKGAYLLDAMELADLRREHALDNSSGTGGSAR